MVQDAILRRQLCRASIREHTSESPCAVQARFPDKRPVVGNAKRKRVQAESIIRRPTNRGRLPGRIARTGLACLFSLALAGSALAAGPDDIAAPGTTPRQFTFAWPYQPDDRMAPRGGITTGDSITLATDASPAWQALQAAGLSARERDRRAILAMAGAYRASFDFIETVGFTEGYQPDPPYQSWGTEYVYVVSDEPDFISLQHIMVIRFASAGEDASEPVVVKHWRQDWRYEGRELFVFDGHQQWRRVTLTEEQARGKWVQSVFQVDDSPRYAAVGSWQHTANFSSWTSDETWRPLPRREFSVRDDYDVLIGSNRHTITPTGWVQEEHNLKAALDDDGAVARILARENGLARYERIEGFDWSPGDEYWQRTAPYWAEVRSAWQDYYASNPHLEVSKTADEVPMFVAMFDLAESLTTGEFDATAARREIERTLDAYVAPGSGAR